MESQPSTKRPRKPQIFVSYGRGEANRYADGVKRTLEEAGFSCFVDREDIPCGAHPHLHCCLPPMFNLACLTLTLILTVVGASWRQELRSAIDGCELCVALVNKKFCASHHEWGAIAEVRKMRERGIPVLPVLLGGHQVPVCDHEGLAAAGLRLGCPYCLLRIDDIQYITEWHDTEAVLRRIVADVRTHLTPSEPPKAHGTQRPRLNHTFSMLGVPTLPGEFQDRPKEREESIAALLRGLPAEGAPGEEIVDIVDRVLIGGEPGTGKTTLTTSICHDAAVQASFPHGVRWLTVGKEFGSELSLQKSLLRLLEDLNAHDASTPLARSRGSSAEEIAQQLDQKQKEAKLAAALADGATELEKMLKGKRCLIVLDDVWKVGLVSKILPPRCLDRGSRLLVTSRRLDVLTAACRRVEVGVLSQAESFRLLLRYARCEVPPPGGEAAELAKRCFGHTLVIAMCGSMVLHDSTHRCGESLKSAIKGADFSRVMTKLSALQQIESKGGALENYQYTNVQAALLASWHDLILETDVPVELLEWLQSHGLEQHHSSFVKEGYDTVAKLQGAQLESSDLKELGVALMIDRKRYLNSISRGPTTKVDDSLQGLLCDLAIFPEDTLIPMSTMWVMCGCAMGVREVARVRLGCLVHQAVIDYDEACKARVTDAILSLANRSLVRVRPAEWRVNRWGEVEWCSIGAGATRCDQVSLHDLVRSFAIEKGGDTLPERHSKLLRNYAALCDSGDWQGVGTVDSYLRIGRYEHPWIEHHVQYASEELRGDREIMLAAVKQDRRVLQHASAELQNDRELVLAAVRKSAEAFQFASPELKADKEMVRMAMAEDTRVLRWASPALRADGEFANDKYRFMRHNSSNFESPLFAPTNAPTQADMSPNPLEHSSPGTGCVAEGASASDSDVFTEADEEDGWYSEFLEHYNDEEHYKFV